MTSLSPIAASMRTSVAQPATGGATQTDDGFEAALREAGPAATASPSFRHQSSRSAELQPEQAFESFVLRSFIEEMLPKENTAVFGGGTAGNIWRSMLAERVADEMAASGGIGIADTIRRDAQAAKTG